MQIKAVDQALQSGGEHLVVGGVGVSRVGAGKRDAVAAQYGDAANALGHFGILL